MKIKLQPGAKRPRKGTKGSAAYDLGAIGSHRIYSGQRALIPTGVHMEIPRGEVGMISHRSGMNAKKGATAFGLIDSDYRGEIFISLLNTGPYTISIEDGDWIAQITFVNISQHTFEEVATLSDTKRGGDGYGSTGK